MAYPPPTGRPRYRGWWYLWVAIAIGMAAVWLVFFTGFFLTEEATETSDNDDVTIDGFVVENDTEMIPETPTSALIKQFR